MNDPEHTAAEWTAAAERVAAAIKATSADVDLLAARFNRLSHLTDDSVPPDEGA